MNVAGVLAVLGMFLSVAVVALLIISAVLASYTLFKCFGIAVLLFLWCMFELGSLKPTNERAISRD